MPLVGIVYGILLCVLGIAGYLLTGSAHPTALIPLAFGLPTIIAGAIARTEKYLKHAMHAAATISLLGFLGTAPGLLTLPRLLSGHEVERPGAVISKSIMAMLSLIFLILCVRSFIDARRARSKVAR